MTEKKELTSFEKMKKIEEAKKKRTMARLLTKVKELATEIQESKLLCQLYLEQVSNDGKECKQMIDWINELPDVKPDEDVIKELKQKAKDEAKEEKKKIEEKIKQDPDKWMKDMNLAYYSDGVAYCNTASNTSLTANIGRQVLCSSDTGINVG